MTVDPQVFLQYGALGLTAALALAAVKVLFARETKNHDRERERADRLEEQLRELNHLIQTQYMTALGDASKAVSEALQIVRRQD